MAQTNYEDSAAKFEIHLSLFKVNLKIIYLSLLYLDTVLRKNLFTPYLICDICVDGLSTVSPEGWLSSDPGLTSTELCVCLGGGGGVGLTGVAGFGGSAGLLVSLSSFNNTWKRKQLLMFLFHKNVIFCSFNIKLNTTLTINIITNFETNISRCFFLYKNKKGRKKLEGYLGLRPKNISRGEIMTSSQSVSSIYKRRST